MTLFSDELPGYLTTYLKEIATDAMNKSPYNSKARKLHMARNVTDCQKNVEGCHQPNCEITSSALFDIAGGI